jgi:hypothetical protein
LISVLVAEDTQQVFAVAAFGQRAVLHQFTGLWSMRPIPGSAIGSIGRIASPPAAVWLFGSALAGLGWMRRKQTV